MIRDLRMHVATAAGAHCTLSVPDDMLRLLHGDLAAFELQANGGLPVITVRLERADPPMVRSRLYIAPNAIELFPHTYIGDLE